MPHGNSFMVGQWTVEPDLDRISRGGEKKALRPQVMELLVYLARRGGEVCRSEDLLRDLWPNKVVTDATLYNCVAELRHQLDEGADGPGYIQTIPKKGYRLLAPVGGLQDASELDQPESPNSEAHAASRRMGSKIAADLAAGGRRIDLVIIVILAAAIILILAWERPAPTDEALTVLPFESLAGSDEASFSKGVATELQNLLARLSKFKVKQPPNASILARFPDIQALADEMDVRWVLQGSVRHADNRVRIAVQLIDADDDASIAWSNIFDRELSASNLFYIQAEIARSIAHELRQSLDTPAEQRLAAPPTQDTEAYESYLLGRQRLGEGSSRRFYQRVGWIEDAIEQFAKAIDRDRDFGEAYSGLADACYMYQGLQQFERCPDSKAGLVALARKAVQLDPDSGEGWISLGTMLANSIDRSTFLDAYKTFVSVTAEADAAFQRGLVLQPGYSRGYLWYGHFLRRKAILDNSFNENTSYDMAWVEVWRQGLEVDPLSLDLHVLISVDSPPEDSLWHAQRAVEIAPDSPLGFLRLGEVLWVEHGRVDESIRAISKAAELDPRNPDAPWHNGLAYTALGDYEMARAYFRLLKVRVEDTRLETMFGEAMSLLLLNENRTDEAVLMLEEFLSRNQKSFWPLWILASIDVSTGQADKALMRFREQLPECFDDSRPIKFLTDCSGPVFLRILQEVGDEQTAQRVAADITADLELPRESAEGLIKARYYAMAGLPEDALSALELYLEKGLRGYTSLSLDWRFFAYHDVTLDSIRDHPRFRRATVVIEADMAQQLQNVREMEQRGEVPNLEAVNALIESAQE